MINKPTCSANQNVRTKPILSIRKAIPWVDRKKTIRSNFNWFPTRIFWLVLRGRKIRRLHWVLLQRHRICLNMPGANSNARNWISLQPTWLVAMRVALAMIKMR